MGDKVEEAKKRWFSESREIQETNKKLLLAFGLNHLEIRWPSSVKIHAQKTDGGTYR
jgi:hypothetical protein